jgi:hypothetical protein
MGSAAQGLPYWQVNIPEHLRTTDCPDFLRNLTDKDRGIISTLDSEYEIDSWAVVQQKVAQNRLDLFQRVPSDLRRYLGFSWKLKQDYGSVMNFILNSRLQWTLPITPRGRPFEFDDDIKILRNDWPYGIDRRITHLVVWTKFSLEEDPATGDLTDAARAEIDAYVRKTFGRMPLEHVRRKPPCWSESVADGRSTGHLVQELGIAQVREVSGAFPRHVV